MRREPTYSASAAGEERVLGNQKSLPPHDVNCYNNYLNLLLLA